MEILKFRAWNMKTELFIDNFDFAISGEGEVYLYTQGISEDGFIRLTEDLKIVQYINANDKNGKEIYEGDILKDNYGRILLVERFKHGFSFKAISKTNFLRARDISQWFENGETPPEIIGNARENPELLKEAKPQK